MRQTFEHVIIVLSAEAFDSLGLDQLDEGRWTPSEHRGYSLRIDPARSEMRQQRHVHIARDKHTTAKHKQVAWNADQTRHDRKSFNAAFQGMEVAKGIARKALGLPPDALLESVSPRDHLHFVTAIVLDEALDGSDGPLADLTNTLCLALLD